MMPGVNWIGSKESSSTNMTRKELTESERTQIRTYAQQGDWANKISKNMTLSVGLVLEFLKSENLYKDGRKMYGKNGSTAEYLKQSVRNHRGENLKDLARPLAITKEGVRQWFIRNKRFDRWKKDLCIKQQQKREIAFGKKHLPDMVNHLQYLDTLQEARVTNNTYLQEILEKEILTNGQTGWVKFEYIPRTIALLHAYDTFVKNEGRTPKYREITSLVPDLKGYEITFYLARAKRPLTIYPRPKRRELPQMQSHLLHLILTKGQETHQQQQTTPSQSSVPLAYQES